MSHTTTAEKTRHHKAAQVILLGAITNIILAILKCIMGWFGHSSALFADGIHSFSDLFSDLIVYIASKYGNEKADRDHPYGHHRIETAGTIIVAIFLVAAAIGIIVHGAQHVFIHSLHQEKIHLYVLIMAICSVVANEIIYYLTLKIAKKIHSEMLRAHAWHRRSDGLTALIVLIGVIGSLMGFAYLDGICAIIVGCFIFKMAFVMARDSFQELIDHRGLSQKTVDEIKESILNAQGVEGLHQLRTRTMGGKIFADIHIIVNPHLSVSEGHFIGDQVACELKRKFKVNDVVVHIDSENDELFPLKTNLPSRAHLEKMLTQCQVALPACESVEIKMIHYVENQVILELLFPIKTLENYSSEYLLKSYCAALNSQDYFLHLKLFFT